MKRYISPDIKCLSFVAIDILVTSQQTNDGPGPGDAVSGDPADYEYMKQTSVWDYDENK